VARTAAIAGTATAVSNRVSRRQANRWASQDQAEYEQQQYAQQQQYAAPPPQYAEPQYAAPPPPPPPPAGGSQDEMFDQLRQLGELHDKGILTDEEFAAQKAKILGS
jgi:hypothetical protein